MLLTVLINKVTTVAWATAPARAVLSEMARFMPSKTYHIFKGLSFQLFISACESFHSYQEWFPWALISQVKFSHSPLKHSQLSQTFSSQQMPGLMCSRFAYWRNFNSHVLKFLPTRSVWTFPLDSFSVEIAMLYFKAWDKVFPSHWISELSSCDELVCGFLGWCFGAVFAGGQSSAPSSIFYSLSLICCLNLSPLPPM